MGKKTIWNKKLSDLTLNDIGKVILWGFLAYFIFIIGFVLLFGFIEWII